MPDHFHLLITVGLGITIERAVQLIKGGFAFRAGKELGFSAPVWQKGFSEIRVLGVDAFEKQKKYIHENPVRARLAATAQQFPYSSASGLFNVDPPPTWLQPALCSA